MLHTRGIRKGTNGVSTNGVTANFMFFERGTFWVLPLIYCYLPKSAGAFLFPNLSKFITFAAAPVVLTPFVRNQIVAITILCVFVCFYFVIMVIPTSIIIYYLVSYVS